MSMHVVYGGRGEEAYHVPGSLGAKCSCYFSDEVVEERLARRTALLKELDLIHIVCTDCGGFGHINHLLPGADLKCGTCNGLGVVAKIKPKVYYLKQSLMHRMTTPPPLIQELQEPTYSEMIEKRDAWVRQMLDRLRPHSSTNAKIRHFLDLGLRFEQAVPLDLVRTTTEDDLAKDQVSYVATETWRITCIACGPFKGKADDHILEPDHIAKMRQLGQWHKRNAPIVKADGSMQRDVPWDRD